MEMELFKQICFAPSSSSSTSPLASSSSSSSSLHPSAAHPFELEHMFDKVVTPSDVGKLNRLVIPKQHAEKYFPLDPLTADKGVLLCFEDRTGKQWEFRYSYWNSSQSYVMTKGWSRFVKDKQLYSGDTVSFSRAASGAASGRGRLFIDWHPRQQLRRHRPPLLVPHFYAAARSVAAQWGGILPSAVPSMYCTAANLGHGQYGGGKMYAYHQSMPGREPPQVRVQVGGGMTGAPLVLESVLLPAPSRLAKPKRVRLFGVDLECSEADGHGETSRDELQVLPKPSLQWRTGAAASDDLVCNGEGHEEDGKR